MLLVRKIGPELTSLVNLLLFFPPQSRSTQLYILAVGHSSSCIWHVTTAWLDEQYVGLGSGYKTVNPDCQSRSAQIWALSRGPVPDHHLLEREELRSKAHTGPETSPPMSIFKENNLPALQLFKFQLTVFLFWSRANLLWIDKALAESGGTHEEQGHASNQFPQFAEFSKIPTRSASLGRTISSSAIEASAISSPWILDLDRLFLSCQLTPCSKHPYIPPGSTLKLVLLPLHCPSP